MQKYVKKEDGEDGPQKAQHRNPNRQAIAAMAKVPVKGRPASRQSQPVHSHANLQAQSGIGNAQNIFAAIHPVPARRASGQKQKHDRYDSDAESIDTTVNQSVFQAENVQPVRQKVHPHTFPNNGLASGEFEDDEEGSNDGEGDDQYAFTDSDVEYLQNAGKGHLSRDEAVDFLFQNRKEVFPLVEGDSYPTTTNGDPSDWQGEQDLTSDAFGDGGHVSPSPQSRTVNGHALPPAPPMQRVPVDTGRGQTVDRNHVLLNKATALRNQERANTNPNTKPGHGLKDTTTPLPSSQPPRYSQVDQSAQPQQARNNHSRSVNQPFIQQPLQLPRNISSQVPSPSHATVQPPPAADFRMPAKQPFAARPKEVPSIYEPPVQRAPSEHEQILADYDVETLHKMNYAQLKDESFDLDPRAPDQPLGENMLEKPLADRLEHVQKNLDPRKQADFFRSLPTADWEDAGDWFLKQFGSVITRTKEARQRKRKLAQGFEDEIEKRHKHVSKKQRQVETAMDKMKAQGEGLVPRSPRPSKSPKPKKR